MALKHWNFPEKFKFKGKVVAKNVGKISHKKSLSLNIKEYNNKITNQPLSLQKVCHLHNGIFQPIRLC